MDLSATGYFYNISAFKVFDKTIANNDFKLYKYIGIGSDLDWWHFLKIQNERQDLRNYANEYRLTSDIDFHGQNYANYCIGGYGCISMIVGDSINSAFNKRFDGQGYTLKNINIDANYKDYVGIFGVVDNAYISNINVDYQQGVINTVKAKGMGGFAGYIGDGKFSNIYVNDIDYIGFNNKIQFNTLSSYAGGFVGYVDGGDFGKILMKNNHINSYAKVLSYAGGFAGYIHYGTLKNFKDINMLFTSDANIQAVSNDKQKEILGLVFGDFAGDSKHHSHIVFNNVNVYYHEDKFKDIQDKNKYNVEGINIKTYTNKDKELNDFSSFVNFVLSDNVKPQIQNIAKPEKPIMLKPSESKPEKPNLNDFDVVLAEDDLHKDVIIDQIIREDIMKQQYEIDINAVKFIVKNYDKYLQMQENDRVEFIAKYFLKNHDKTAARKILQSIDFIVAYHGNDLSNSGNRSMITQLKSEILSEIKGVLVKQEKLENFMKQDLNNLVINSDDIYQQLLSVGGKIKTTFGKIKTTQKC